MDWGCRETKKVRSGPLSSRNMAGLSNEWIELRTRVREEKRKRM